MTTATVSLTAGTWAGDAVHTEISMSVRHMAVGKVRGNFSLVSAELVVPETGITGATVNAVIDADSLNTKNADRDAHIKSGDFLETDKYPTIEFASTGVKHLTDEGFVLAGDLTLHGVTRPVELSTEFVGETVDAYGLTRSGFSATTTINRKDYDVSIDMAFGAGNKVVGDKIEITLDIEFVRNAD